MSKRPEQMSMMTATPRSYSRQGGQPRKRVNPWWQNSRAMAVTAGVVALSGVSATGVWLWQSGVLPQAADHSKWRLI